MKYRMQRDPDGAVWLLENERINMETRAYHEAAVEFWGEIERLQAANAELLAACKALLQVLQKSIPPYGEQVTSVISDAQAAIARAEPQEHTP